LRVVSKDDLGSPYPKCSLFLRLGARLIDLAFAWLLFHVFDAAGGVVSILYLLLGDGLMHGQSLGKRLFGIRVVHLPTRSGARYRESMLRNAPFGLVVLFVMMPDPLGARAFMAAVVLIGSVEIFRVLRDPLGIRLGDVWGQTQVVDGKVISGATELVATEHERAPGRVMFAARWGLRLFAPERSKRCASR
jgi:uncharacterized RDD family membrane protein YckC